MEDPGEGRAGGRDEGGPESGPRASDAEREWFCDVLERHFADGRLTREELDERLDRALRARGLSELYALVSDLPVPPAFEASRAGQGRIGRKLRRRRI